MREKLIDNQNRIDNLRKEWVDELKALDVDLRQVVLDKAKTLKPRAKKMDFSRACQTLGREQVNDIYEEFRAKAKEVSALTFGAIDALETENWRIAENITLASSGDEWTLFDVKRSSTWGSQGFGACKYAKTAADRQVLKAKVNGLEARIEETDISYCRHYGVKSATYMVYIRGTQEDAIILKYKQGLGLVEEVRWMWKNGINPRVHYPFLEHGFEAKHGISFT